MSMLVFAIPEQSGAPGMAMQPELTHTWTGWDGSVWPLHPDHGLWFDDGVRGMGMPDITPYKRQPAVINGSFWYGYVIAERSVFWPLHMDFTEEQDRAFWRTMLPYQTGTWTIQTPSGQIRSLNLRFADDGQWAPSYSPYMTGHATYGITFTAEQPLWQGEPVYTSWAAPVQKLFFGGGDPTDPDVMQAAPPFFISSSSSFNNAQIVNDGDVEAWPIWVINGPCTTCTVGIGTDLITVPFEVPDGQRLKIDTNPTVQKALLGAPDPNDPVGLVGTVTNRTKDLAPPAWSMLPPGGAVDVSITVTGTPPSVGVQYTPLYLRAS